MGNLDKKQIGNLSDSRLPYDYMNREHGTVPLNPDRPSFQWVSEVAYKNIHRIVARGYDTTELMEQGYGVVDMLFIDFQARIPTEEEEKMLNYIIEEGGLPKQTAKNTLKALDALKDELVNPFKVLAVLQTHIPERLLQSHYAEQNPAVFGKREVILSLYLAGE